ncbi:hypothetical protein ACQ4PT_033301 [Festuca glaucescens]
MGSCVSRSPTPPTAATAMVVLVDGFVAQYATLIMARDTLGSDAARVLSLFLCNSDEFCFDTPAHVLAAEEALQPGWLYFMLPLSMLRRPLSGQEMAALAIKANSAFAAMDGWRLEWRCSSSLMNRSILLTVVVLLSHGGGMVMRLEQW